MKRSFAVLFGAAMLALCAGVTGPPVTSSPGSDGPDVDLVVGTGASVALVSPQFAVFDGGLAMASDLPSAFRLTPASGHADAIARTEVVRRGDTAEQLGAADSALGRHERLKVRAHPTPSHVPRERWRT